MRIDVRSCQNLIVALYPPKVHERFRSPQHASIEAVGSRGVAVSFLCGSFVEMHVEISGDEIERAKFRTNGCGFMIAAADVVCGWLSNKLLSDLHGLDDGELRALICGELGEYPFDRGQCATVVFQALHKAMSDHRSLRVSEYKGETALICTCFGVSEDTIVAAIANSHLKDVSDVADQIRAGSGCGSCRMLIQELIDSSDV